MPERAIQRSLRSCVLPPPSFLRRALTLSLAGLTFVALLPPVSRAQQVASVAGESKGKAVSAAPHASAEARPRRIASLRHRETAEGASVVVTSDAELTNYTTYESGGRFFVRIPQAQATDVAASLAESLRGRGFADARVERRGADVLLSFRLEAGATAEVKQSFNRLEVRFTQEPQQQKTNASGTLPTAPADPSPTATPTAATPSDAPVVAPGTTTVQRSAVRRRTPRRAESRRAASTSSPTASGQRRRTGA